MERFLIIAVCGLILSVSLYAEEPTAVRKLSSNYAERVRQNESGDVWIEGIPMIDQGSKPYCSVATVQRLMLYYGLRADEDYWVRVSGVDQGGIRKENFYQVVEEMEKHHLQVERLYQMENIVGYLGAYNELAERGGKETIPIQYFSTNDLNDIYPRMDVLTFLRSRNTTPEKFKQFEKIVSEQIDRGYPVIWFAVYGMVKETPMPPARVQPHARIIIGYNKKTHQIFYTDSWGEGHERKKLHAAEALAISLDLYGIRPRRSGRLRGLAWGRLSETMD